MAFEDAAPRPVRGEALLALSREDLDTYSVEELAERISRLEGEIVRSRTAMESKQARKSATDALFNLSRPA